MSTDPNAKTETRKDFEERLTRESLARGFIEYPKMLHHPDGTTLTVTNKREEEEALRGDWTPSPTEALKVRKSREDAEAARRQEANNAAIKKAEDDKAAAEAERLEEEAKKSKGKK